MNVERTLTFLPGLGALLLIVLVSVRTHRNRRHGSDWYLQPNQVKAVGDLLPTVSGVLMGFTASIIIYSLNIESKSQNTVLIRYNIRNTAVVFELATFTLIFASMMLALYIKSRSYYDVGFPSSHRFEEAEFAREETRRTLEFLASATLLIYTLAISCLLMGLTVAASPYLNDGVIEVITWFPLFALLAVVPLAIRLFSLPFGMEGLAADVHVQVAGSASPLEGRIALWPVHPRHTREEWGGVLALFSDEDYGTLRTSYLRNQPVGIVLAAAVSRHRNGGATEVRRETGTTNAAGLSAFVEAMDLPGRPLRARLAGIGSLAGVRAVSSPQRERTYPPGQAKP